MAEWTPTKKFLALGAAVGTGLLVLHCRRRYADHNDAPIVLDPALDPVTRKVILASLAQERDPKVLHTLATRCHEAGYKKTAEVVGSKAASLVSGEFVGQWSADHVVRHAQHMLQTLGYDVLVDGVLGPRTKRAVERFQSLHDLDITGMLDTFTVASLNRASLSGGA
jgi:hypothetical protein